MKLTNEMDVDLSSAPMTNGDILMKPETLKTSVSQPLPEENPKPKILNGVKYSEQISNGHETINDDVSNEIGIEVESYGSLHSPSPADGHSKSMDNNKAESISQSKQSSCLDLSDADDSCDTSKCLNDSSVDEEELLLDTSNKSEEFELRLSDEDDLNLESTESKNLKSCDDELVSSTTEDSTPGVSCDLQPSDGRESQSGSMCVESINSSSHLPIITECCELGGNGENAEKAESSELHDTEVNDMESVKEDNIEIKSNSEEASLQEINEVVNRKIKVEIVDDYCDSNVKTCLCGNVACDCISKEIKANQLLDKTIIKSEDDNSDIKIKVEDIKSESIIEIEEDLKYSCSVKFEKDSRSSISIKEDEKNELIDPMIAPELILRKDIKHEKTDDAVNLISCADPISLKSGDETIPNQQSDQTDQGNSFGGVKESCSGENKPCLDEGNAESKEGDLSCQTVTSNSVELHGVEESGSAENEQCIDKESAVSKEADQNCQTVTSDSVELHGVKESGSGENEPCVDKKSAVSKEADQNGQTVTSDSVELHDVKESSSGENEQCVDKKSAESKEADQNCQTVTSDSVELHGGKESSSGENEPCVDKESAASKEADQNCQNVISDSVELQNNLRVMSVENTIEESNIVGVSVKITSETSDDEKELALNTSPEISSDVTSIGKMSAELSEIPESQNKKEEHSDNISTSLPLENSEPEAKQISSPPKENLNLTTSSTCAIPDTIASGEDDSHEVTTVESEINVNIAISDPASMPSSDKSGETPGDGEITKSSSEAEMSSESNQPAVQEGVKGTLVELPEDNVDSSCLDNADSCLEEMSEGSFTLGEDDNVMSSSESCADPKDLIERESNDVSCSDKTCSSEPTDSSHRLPSNFSDSTVLDASSMDEDCSSSVSQSNISKENRDDLVSRKRTLSPPEDGFSKSKRLSSIPETNGSKDSSSGVVEPQNSHKRPADDISNTDAKKLRITDESLSKNTELENHNDSSHEEEGQEEERGDQQKCEEEASQGVSVTDPPQELSNLDLAIERVVAKAAAAAKPSEPMDLPFLRKFYINEVSEMSRSDLEELVIQKICEAITERSFVGQLRLRCQALEKEQERDKERFNLLRKQMHELSLVMKKYLDQQKQNIPAPPIKVTRSVGLQVSQALKMVHHQLPTARSKCPLAARSPQAPKVASVAPTVQVPPTTSPLKSPQATSISTSTLSSPRMARPPPNVVSSTDPPALVPSSTPISSHLFPIGSRNSLPSVGAQVPHVQVSSPIQIPAQIQVPPLHQIMGPRPRVNTSSPVQTTSVQGPRHPILPRKPSSPSQTNRQNAASNDVEVIDIIESEESNARSEVKNNNQQNKKQASNAAVHHVPNSGMAVRLISPSQVSQSGMTITSSFQRLIMPQQGISPNVIFTTASQANTLRGNVKFLMKANNGNVVIPLQASPGSTVSSSVMQMTPSNHAAVQQIFTNASNSNRTNTVATVRQAQPSHLSDSIHPAPLPTAPVQASNPAWKQIPPRPNLKIQHQNNGIVLSWNMALGPLYADIESYQLYAYQEGTAPPSAGLWKKVGDVKALPLPMACTLTQFVEGHRYHFTVRAVDKHGRVGPFSQQGSIRLGK